MAYLADIDLEVCIHFGTVKNVDLAARGVYFISATLLLGPLDALSSPPSSSSSSSSTSSTAGTSTTSTLSNEVDKALETTCAKINPVGLFSCPSSFKSHVRGNEITPSHFLKPCQIEETNKSFTSRSFVIRYRDEVHELNEGVHWRLTIPNVDISHLSGKLPANKDLLLVRMKLHFAALNTTDPNYDFMNKVDDVISDEPNFNVISEMNVCIQQARSGLHEFIPVRFNDRNSLDADCMVHTCISRIHFHNIQLPQTTTGLAIGGGGVSDDGRGSGSGVRRVDEHSDDGMGGGRPNEISKDDKHDNEGSYVVENEFTNDVIDQDDKADQDKDQEENTSITDETSASSSSSSASASVTVSSSSSIQTTRPRKHQPTTTVVSLSTNPNNRISQMRLMQATDIVGRVVKSVTLNNRVNAKQNATEQSSKIIYSADPNDLNSDFSGWSHTSDAKSSSTASCDNNNNNNNNCSNNELEDAIKMYISTVAENHRVLMESTAKLLNFLGSKNDVNSASGVGGWRHDYDNLSIPDFKSILQSQSDVSTLPPPPPFSSSSSSSVETSSSVFTASPLFSSHVTQGGTRITELTHLINEYIEAANAQTTGRVSFFIKSLPQIRRPVSAILLEKYRACIRMFWKQQMVVLTTPGTDITKPHSLEDYITQRLLDKIKIESAIGWGDEELKKVISSVTNVTPPTSYPTDLLGRGLFVMNRRVHLPLHRLPIILLQQYSSSLSFSHSLSDGTYGKESSSAITLDALPPHPPPTLNPSLLPTTSAEILALPPVPPIADHAMRGGFVIGCDKRAHGEGIRDDVYSVDPFDEISLRPADIAACGSNNRGLFATLVKQSSSSGDNLLLPMDKDMNQSRISQQRGNDLTDAVESSAARPVSLENNAKLTTTGPNPNPNPNPNPTIDVASDASLIANPLYRLPYYPTLASTPKIMKQQQRQQQQQQQQQSKTTSSFFPPKCHPHLIVLVHGFQGNSYDMRLLATHLEMCGLGEDWAWREGGRGRGGHRKNVNSDNGGGGGTNVSSVESDSLLDNFYLYNEEGEANDNNNDDDDDDDDECDWWEVGLEGKKWRDGSAYKSLHIIAAKSNESHSEDSIAEQGKRLAKEVYDYIHSKVPALLKEERPGRISFIGHSLGGLVIRKALEMEIMQDFHCKLHAYISLASPHLGTNYADSSLVAQGMRWYSKCACVKELLLEDASGLSLSMLGKSGHPITHSLVYKLASNDVLAHFQKVVFVSSTKDQYVPTYSARVCVCSKVEGDPKLYQIYKSMAVNLVSQVHPNRLVRITIDNNVGSALTVNSLIGRTAHLCYLENAVVVEQLVYTLVPYLR